MDTYSHAQLSAKRRGGRPEDYMPIHSLLNCTKRFCQNDNHRILHTDWGIHEIVLKSQGETLVNSDGVLVSVKTVCEEDHVLPDFDGRFIPLLSDFVNSITLPWQNTDHFFKFASLYMHDRALLNLMLSPIGYTGLVHSLYLTHNSWFVDFLAPLALSRKSTIDRNTHSYRIPFFLHHIKLIPTLQTDNPYSEFRN
jgi:hypothetical protein